MMTEIGTKEDSIKVDDPVYTVSVQHVTTDSSLSILATPPKVVEMMIPALAFGLYMVPDTYEGEQIILGAIHHAGYRHFDSASIYRNERTLGRALARCNVPRSELTIASKVWNDAQRNGRDAVRASVETTLNDIGCEYLDICYVHWPVPGCYVDTYKELQVLQQEGKIRSLGISNFGIVDYEYLMSNIADKDLTVRPHINQIEVSPFMYRPMIIEYFQSRGILIAASKALHRGKGIEDDDAGSGVVRSIATSHGVTPAQVLLRWSVQHSFIVLTKTSRLERMKENRGVLNFTLCHEEMLALDALTSNDAIQAREELEIERKSGI
jgi:diketogulonate reductase-like aldo/keto reductase